MRHGEIGRRINLVGEIRELNSQHVYAHEVNLLKLELAFWNIELAKYKVDSLKWLDKRTQKNLRLKWGREKEKAKRHNQLEERLIDNPTNSRLVLDLEFSNVDLYPVEGVKQSVHVPVALENKS